VVVTNHILIPGIRDVGDTSTEACHRSHIRLTLEPGNYTYRAQITDNQNNTVDSDPIQVDITTPGATVGDCRPIKKILVVTVGSTANVPLFVTATGGSEPYSYTWYQR
jgi:hypothetical protein